MIIIIAATAENNALGKNNDLIWHLPADLQRFKKVTSGYPIIMGRNTFESIGRPLPNRTTVIVTRNKEYSQKDCLVANSLEEAIQLVEKSEKLFIIGGAQIYKEAMQKQLADQLDITLVHDTFEADVYFPEIDTEIWEEVAKQKHFADEKNKYDYSFITYKKK
jgi:dihydrofolate reductase